MAPRRPLLLPAFLLLLPLLLALTGPKAAAAAPGLAEERSALEARSRTIREVAAQARPCVVHIRCRLPDKLTDLVNPEASSSAPEDASQALFASGSGVVIDPEGFILTSYHVVRSAVTIRVRLADRREFAAELVSFDPRSDLALLRVEAAGLPAARLGDSDRNEVGDWVIAIGSPLGIQQTVTAGIISATGRDLFGSDSDPYAYQDFILSDVAVSAGSSGGPLLNLDGEVIGIAHAVGYQQTGFTLVTPINLVKNVLEHMKQGRGAPRGRLGAGLRDVDQETAAASGLDRIYGAQIEYIERDSPAAEAGLRTGDIVLRVGTVEVRGSSHLQTLVACAPVNREISLTVFRAGRAQEVRFVLRPGRTVIEDGPLGLALTDLTHEIAQTVGIDRPQGALIVSVRPKSVGMQAGFRIGMVVVAVNGLPTPDIAAYRQAMQEVKQARRLQVFVNVRGKLHIVQLDREQAEEPAAAAPPPETAPIAAVSAPASAEPAPEPPDGAISPRYAERDTSREPAPPAEEAAAPARALSRRSSPVLPAPPPPKPIPASATDGPEAE